MVLLEAAVHSSLRTFSRELESPWPHHLTMGRLVARALRLKRSSLIQTGTDFNSYCISYLIPAFLGDSPVLIVAESGRLEYLKEIGARIREHLKTDKRILTEKSRSAESGAIILTTPEEWLNDRIGGLGHFPENIPTLIDGSENLENWTVNYLTLTLKPGDWRVLYDSYPEKADFIRNRQAELTRSIFGHPPNPYDCYLIDEVEKKCLEDIFGFLTPNRTPFQAFQSKMNDENYLLWTEIDRVRGQFTLSLTPMEIESVLKPIWEKQPFVLIGTFLDVDKEARLFRQQHGNGDLLTVKFNAPKDEEPIDLYCPPKLPLPNSPEFPAMLKKKVGELIECSGSKTIVLIIEDTPLKTRFGTLLAADYGSRVRVERTDLKDNGILVCGWRFWRERQRELPLPGVLIIATLPIPSPENPLVAGRIAYHKRNRRDWFRYYLLPTAIKELQRAIYPSRGTGALIAVFDNRVNARAYGSRFLEVLEPYARLDYLEQPLNR